MSDWLACPACGDAGSRLATESDEQGICENDNCRVKTFEVER